MIGLALRHLAHHRLRSALLVLAVAIGVALPWAVHALVGHYEARLQARAEATPYVLGATGNRYDLVLSALYFRQTPVAPVTVAHAQRVVESGLARAYPLHLGFTAARHPLVGCTVDYLAFRELQLAQGRPFAILGEAVVGANVQVGNTVLSDQHDLLNLAASYPLELRVVGRLAPTNSPDDDAIFVDLKTAWTIAGIGHGHQDLAEVAREGEKVVQADASLRQHQVVTADNVDSFHLHGDPATFPVHAVLVDPNDAKAGTLLRARQNVRDKDGQMLRPAETIAELMGIVLRVRRFLDANFALVGLATSLLLLLIVALSIRIRATERATLAHLGASRGFVFGVIAIEWVVILAVAVALAWGAVLATHALAPTVTQL